MSIKSSFWEEQIKLSIFLGLISIIALIPYILLGLKEIPRNGMTLISSVFATLLGLTFTSFAIIITLMPNIRRDFLSTNTFTVFLETFKIVLYIQLVSMINGIVNYFVFGTNLYFIGGLTIIILIIFSLGFFAYLLKKTFQIARIVRNKIIEN